MSTPLPDEFLSAYLDGELTSAERADVERRLESSSRLRERLNELAEVSLAVRSLPRSAAPAGLKDDVLRLVAKRNPVQPRPIPARALWRRPWALSSLAAMCAVAVTGSLVLFRHGEQEGGPLLAQREAMLTASSVAREEANRDGRASGDSYASDAASVANTEGDPVEVLTLTSDQVRSKLKELGRPVRSGDSVTVSNEAGDILVVFTVVDVMETVDNVHRALFRCQQVHLADGSDAQGANASSDPQFQTVSLEGNREEVASILDGIRCLDVEVYETRGAVASADESDRPDETPAQSRDEQADKVAVREHANSSSTQRELTAEAQRNFRFSDQIVGRNRGDGAKNDSDAPAVRTDEPSSSAGSLAESPRQLRGEGPEAGDSAAAKATQDRVAGGKRPASSSAVAKPSPSTEPAPGSWEQARRMRAILVIRRSPELIVPAER